MPELSHRAFAPGLMLLCGSFFVLALAAKVLQLYTLGLHAQDFWAFEDMLRQLARGAPFLTRFAPHEAGWEQHGAIHAFWVFYLFLPFVWTLGSVATALLISPVFLSLGGAALGFLLRRHLGVTPTLIFVFSFLFSSYVDKTVTYETHPESAYPLFVFLWMLGCGWASEHGRARAWLWFPALVLGMLVKIDGFLVFLPLAASGLFIRQFRESERRTPLLISAALVPLIAAFQFYALHKFGTGQWGVSSWEGLPVAIPQGDSRFFGKRWDSPLILFQVVSSRLGEANFAGFFFSRPWLGLVIVAPWVMKRAAFWVSILPAALSLCFLGELARKMMLYYSMPLLGAFWGWAGLLTRSPKKAAGWVLISTCLLSPGDLEFPKPTASLIGIRSEAKALANCIEKLQILSVVGDPLLEFAPRALIYGDRFPRDFEPLSPHKNISAALFARPPDGSNPWIETLVQAGWKPLQSSTCSAGPLDGSILLLVHPKVLLNR
jgi:hypothetical protein